MLIRELLDDGFTLEAAAAKVEERTARIKIALAKLMKQRRKER